jgi:hypothetical protein
MRVLKTSDLRRYSRAELRNLLRRISKALPKGPKGSTERRVILLNLRRVRETLECESLAPF